VVGVRRENRERREVFILRKFVIARVHMDVREAVSERPETAERRGTFSSFNSSSFSEAEQIMATVRGIF
jgi:hypothetical protein